MRSHKFNYGERVRITAGDFGGEEGEVFEYLPRHGYIVRIRHEGFPGQHYHHVRIEERHLERVK